MFAKRSRIGGHRETALPSLTMSSAAFIAWRGACLNYGFALPTPCFSMFCFSNCWTFGSML